MKHLEITITGKSKMGSMNINYGKFHVAGGALTFTTGEINLPVEITAKTVDLKQGKVKSYIGDTLQAIYDNQNFDLGFYDIYVNYDIRCKNKNLENEKEIFQEVMNEYKNWSRPKAMTI